MESRIQDTTSDELQGRVGEKLLDDLKAVVQRAEEKAVERAKAADRVVREHPYQTIGLAFGLGLLIGILVRHK
jgi:ElaB/YqjD/DUF883 family membrane-anchored ribosome-binding protein